MLIRINEGGSLEPVTTQIHDWWFQHWMRNLGQDEFQGVVDAVNQHIDTTGKGEIITTSWIPGRNWADTPYEPIYFAADQDWRSARLFYGLIVWRVMRERPELWGFGRYPKRQGEIIGLTYFRVHVPTADVA